MDDLRKAEVEVWNGLKEDVAAVVAARTLLRLLPNLSFGKISQNPAINLTADFRRALTQVIDLTGANRSLERGQAFELVRLTLQSTIQVSEELAQKAPYYAAKAAEAAAKAGSHSSPASTAQAARDAAHYASSATRPSEAASISRTICRLVLEKSHRDIETIRNLGNAACSLSPLLSANDPYLNDFWNNVCNSAFGASSSFTFWRRWYQGFLDGKPLEWELQRRVALIDDAIWEAGPEAVAQEIERIERLFDLEREIAALKDMLPLRSALSSTGLIGDNGGPPLDDGVQRAVRGDFVLVWDQIEDLEAEIAKPEPSPGRLKAIAKTLWDVSLRIAAYCGGKIDLALTEASKEAGKAVVKLGAPIAAASLASQNESIQQVAKAIWAFVKTLPPG